MHLLVIGAGLSGVCSAWYLRQAGFDVSVVERQPGPALETSFANGGQISISHPEPWANPSAPGTALRWLGRADAPLRFRPHADRRQWVWALAFLRECLPERTRRNTAAIAHLARYSRDSLVALRQELNLSYDQQTRGILHLYFSQQTAAEAPHRARELAMLGIPSRVLSVDQAVQEEPALVHLAPQLKGALYGSDDESGDAHLFTAALAEEAYTAGVRFIFGSEVTGFDRDADGHLRGLHMRDSEGHSETLHADGVVLCAGSYSPLLGDALGERLPIYPVKGYSVTVPIADYARAPHVSLTDEARRIVCSRLGDRLRVAGTAELDGYSLERDPARSLGILEWLDNSLPGAADLTNPEFWCGLRPTTPSNRPWIGPSARTPGLWFNTGHGTLGWTLACGSARALAEILSGRTPPVDFPFLRRRNAA